MSSTYLALCQKFRKLVGISGSGPASVLGQSGMNEKITIWVADADEEIQRVWEDWEFLLEPKEVITATAGTSTFTLDDLSITDLGRWKRTSFFRDPGSADYSKLKWHMTFEEYLRSEYYLGAAQTGVIERVIIRDSDDALIFYPTPAANTTIWGAYYKAPTRLATNSATSPIPARYEDAILLKAKMSYAEHYENLNLYKIAEAEFTKIMDQLESRFAPGHLGMQSSTDEQHLDVVVE